MAVYFIPKVQVPNAKSPVLSKEDLANIAALSSLTDQLKRLTAVLELPPEEIEERRSACAEMLQTLRKFYPDSSLLMFGSSMNSFGVKGCDLDLLFLPFPSYCNSDYASNGEEKEKMQTPNPASILTGEVSNNVLAKLDEYNHLKFIRSVLKLEKIGKRTIIVRAPQCLILRFILNKNKTICDISANNRLVVFNSELLQFFEKLDDRVKPLVICLRYWAKSLGFIKRSFFSSYSFALLVIFFLQSTSPPILPSVQHLIKMSGFSRMTLGWQTAFSTDLQRVPKSKNNQTIGELMIQFFDFYFRFDFLQKIVSPHCGKPLLIDDIKNSKDERMANFEIAQLNIQDVFILSSNVCKIEKLAVFKLALLTAYEMLKGKEKMESHTLFDPSAYQRTLDLHYNKCISNRSQVCFVSFDYECMKKFDSLQMWYEKASETVYEVLQCGMLMECEVTDKFYSCKKKGSYAMHKKEDSFGSSLKNSSASTPYDLQLLISIQCVLFSRTWIGRKSIQVTSTDSQDEDLEVFADSVLGNEYCISKTLVSKNPKLSSQVPILCFECECYKHVCPEFRNLVIMLKPLSTSKEFIQASAFLASFIPKTVKKILTSN